MLKLIKIRLLYKNNVHKNMYSTIKNGDRLKMYYVKSDDKMTEKLGEYYKQYVKEQPKLILPTLPKLKKI